MVVINIVTKPKDGKILKEIKKEFKDGKYIETYIYGEPNAS
jgi:hypothetical protein